MRLHGLGAALVLASLATAGTAGVARAEEHVLRIRNKYDTTALFFGSVPAGTEFEVRVAMTRVPAGEGTTGGASFYFDSTGGSLTVSGNGKSITLPVWVRVQSPDDMCRPNAVDFIGEGYVGTDPVRARLRIDPQSACTFGGGGIPTPTFLASDFGFFEFDALTDFDVLSIERLAPEGRCVLCDEIAALQTSLGAASERLFSLAGAVDTRASQASVDALAQQLAALQADVAALQAGQTQILADLAELLARVPRHGR